MRDGKVRDRRSAPLLLLRLLPSRFIRHGPLIPPPTFSGYEFQSSEMRWGVTKANANNHETSDLCLREVRACQSISDGINFVVRYYSRKLNANPAP